jgi:hypothetical protein
MMYCTIQDINAFGHEVEIFKLFLSCKKSEESFNNFGTITATFLKWTKFAKKGLKNARETVPLKVLSSEN